MSEYTMRPAVREKVRRLLAHYFATIYHREIDAAVNDIERYIRDDIEMVDDEPAEALEFHPPQTMGDR